MSEQISVSDNVREGRPGRGNTKRHLLVVQVALLACLLVGALAAGAAGAFSIGAYSLLYTPPLINLSLTLILLFAGVRAIGGGTASRGVAVLATLAWASAVAVVLVRLAAAAVIPLDERNIQTWHLWPLFTLMGVLALSAPLLLAALVVRIRKRLLVSDRRAWPSSFAARLVFLAAIAALTAVAFGPRVHQFVAVDACLDAGGTYGAAAEECIFTTSSSDAR